MSVAIRRLVASLCVSLLLVSGVSGAGDDRLDDFLAAERALDGGDLVGFDALLFGLRDHPLYPYLLYRLIRSGPLIQDSVEGFLASYPDTPLAERLRTSYLDDLAAAGRWVDYLRVYRDDGSVERQCLMLRALVETGCSEEALSEVRIAPLWLVSRSQPAACDPLFAAWRAAGGLTSRLVWQRIRLAMEAGSPGLARYLGALLPASQRPLLGRWLSARADPASLAVPGLLADRHWIVPAILADTIVALARSDPRAAAAVLGAAGGRLAADPKAWDRAHAAVGIALAEDGEPSEHALGLAIWDRMSAYPDNLDAQERRLRSAVRLAAWDRIVDWVRRMPDCDRKAERWLYWLARAQEALGDPGATQTYRRAATRRSLWGFLAADRLGLGYRFGDHPVPADPERVRALVTTPAYARIRALRRLGRWPDMRREWRTLTRDMAVDDLMAAAYVADVLGWHDQAVFTLARTGFWDDLKLRFPLEYRALVAEQSWQSGVPEPWLFAVIRQESVFSLDAASPAGALGLMQLMPETAQRLARDPELMLEIAPGGLSRWDILVPETNIALGSEYLSRMLGRFGHLALATAAYNAGPRRVVGWLPEQCMSADRWIISIPFRETRGYVERVLLYLAIYAHRLGFEPVRLSGLLPPVPGRGWWESERSDGGG